MRLREWGHRLTASWRWGLFTPGLLLGWELLAGLFALVRWLGQRPGWSGPLVVAIVGLLVMTAGQFMQVAR